MLVRIWIRNDSHQGSELVSIPWDIRYDLTLIEQYLERYIKREYGEEFRLYDYQRKVIPNNIDA